MVYIEPQYFPPISVIQALIKHDEVGMVLNEKYRKMSFRNRCMVPGSNGIINLTIPIIGGREVNQLMGEVQIDNTQQWQVQHWRTLTSIYARSPWFEYYAPHLKMFYTQNYTLLYQWNLDLLQWLFKVLHVELKTVTIEKKSLPADDLDIQDTVLPKNYTNVKMNDNQFYQQVFADKIGFKPNLSSIDLLFCEGTNALSLLTI
jgi:hypothetical protein